MLPLPTPICARKKAVILYEITGDTKYYICLLVVHQISVFHPKYDQIALIQVEFCYPLQVYCYWFIKEITLE